MPSRDLVNRPMAFCLLANREVSTWSEERRHECEVAHVLSLAPEKRRHVIYGVPGASEHDKTGTKGHRGAGQAAFLWDEVERLNELRQKSGPDPVGSRNIRRGVRNGPTTDIRCGTGASPDWAVAPVQSPQLDSRCDFTSGAIRRRSDLEAILYVFPQHPARGRPRI